MIKYEIYKMMHYLGLFLAFFGLGGLLISHFSGHQLKGKAKFMSFFTHGFGLVLILVGGFGMLARLGVFGNLPTWVYGKLVAWLLLGLAISFAKRKAGWLSLALILAIGLSAASFALYKPVLF